MKLFCAVFLLAVRFCAAGEPGHLVEGKADSPVRVVIYEDLQCPDCADFRRMLDTELLPRYGGRVAFEHRDFPLAKHAWARKAAIASRLFYETNPALAVAWRRYVMASQKEISAANFEATLARFAREHGVPEAKAAAALNDPKLAAAVEADYQEGVARGVARTPTVLVNGVPFIEQFPLADIAKAIDAELGSEK